MTIESASVLHRDAIAELWKKTGLTTSYNDPYTDFDFAKRGPNSDVLAGLVDGRVAATAMVGHDGHRGWLYYVAVDPEHQGNGLGAQIVSAGEAWLRSRGIWKVQLMIRETNSAVKAFYEHLDYEQSSVIVMSKKIAEGF
jgi:ribosomal protein S18 acetylase RimI-like enzyme